MFLFEFVYVHRHSSIISMGAAVQVEEPRWGGS